MSAYVIVDIEVTDPAAFGQYAEVAGPIIAKYGGKFLAVGPPGGAGVGAAAADALPRASCVDEGLSAWHRGQSKSERAYCVQFYNQRRAGKGLKSGSCLAYGRSGTRASRGRRVTCQASAPQC